ncbi:MAG TPA: hypothetical protein VFM38_13550, partial [Candidatus Limnocylindrales bacterium]|nr:hypothetical protein [Candidatus Limnocylindrales bacterium]
MSAYLDAGVDDPAERRAWRVRLDQSLRDLRAWLTDASHEERAMFERCVEHLDARLTAIRSNVGPLGWAAFITANGVQDAEALPAPMPTLAVWSTGMCIAPYMRSLKQTRPVIIAIADARETTLHRYQAGALDRLEQIQARSS